MKKFFIILFFLILNFQFYSNSEAINYYKYPDKNFDGNICKLIYEELDFPQPNYDLDEPTVIKTDLYLDRIFEIDPKNATFEAQINLWLTWKEERLIPILEKYGLYTNEGKPNYLCSYDQNSSFSNFKLFDPAVEFFNRKDKPPVENYMSDWIDIFSNGTVDQRLKDTATFQTEFDFYKFPFDSQKLLVELWSEFPSNLIEFIPNEPAMTKYKDSGISPVTGKLISVDGWKIGSIDYETYSYLDKTDDKPYTGFLFYVNIERETSYYVYKIIFPIIFILMISWSVFWVRGSQLDAKVNVTIVCLLSLIAYNFIIDEDLPKLSYLTFLDSFILISYFYTGIATILCVFSYVNKIKTGKNLSYIDIKAQKYGPLSYIGFLLFILIYFYNLEGAGAFLGKMILP